MILLAVADHKLSQEQVEMLKQIKFTPDDSLGEFDCPREYPWTERFGDPTGVSELVLGPVGRQVENLKEELSLRSYRILIYWHDE